MKRIALAVLGLVLTTPHVLARARAVHIPAERCSFSLVPVWGTGPVPAAGLQRAMVLVYGQTALCAQWLSYSDVDWVTVESAPLDAQPAAYVTVAPNVLPAARTTTLAIAGVRLEITQEAASGIRTQSLVVNGTFDTNLFGWGWQDRFPNGFGAASWSPLDANGGPSSGSILLQDFGVGLAFQQLQCIPVKRSTPYLFGAKVRTGSGNERGNGIIAWFNYPAADCSGSFTSQVIRELRPDAPALWQQFSFATVTGSRTEGVILVIASSADVTSFDTWFDDVFVLP
jgi:hypothetical protein